MRLVVCGLLTALVATCAAVAAGPQQIAVGRGPGWVVAAGSAIWVGNHRDSTLERIDPRSGRVTRVVRVGRPGGESGELGNLSGVAATNSAVFGLNGGTRYERLVRVDLESGAVRSTRVASAMQPANSVVANGNTLWLGGGAKVSAIDANSLATLDQADVSNVAASATVLASVDGGVWIGTDSDRLVRLDGATLKPTVSVRLFRQGYMSAAPSGGSLWVAATAQHSVVRVDGRTGKRLSRFTVHAAYGSDSPFPVVAHADARVLWLWRDGRDIEERNATSGALLRTLTLPQLPGATDPGDYYAGGVVTAYGATWVSEWPGAFEGFKSPARGVLLRFGS